MNPHQPDEKTLQKIQQDMLRSFAEEGYPPIEVSADGLVSVTMADRFQVSSVTLHSVKLEPDETVRLEQALVTAINNAIQEVAKRNAERLAQFIDKANP